MAVRGWIAGLLVLVGVGGCASSSTARQQQAGTQYHILQVSGSQEYADSAESPVEAEWEGAHAVDFYVQIALEQNPDILAARHAVAARAEVVPQVTALDDPMLMDTFMPIDDHSVQTAAGRGVNTLSLSQRFPWYGKLRVRGEVAEQEVQLALTRLAQSELKVIEEVHLAYYEIAFHQRAIQITDESARLLELIIEYVNSRVVANERNRQDLLLAQVELAKIQNELISFRRQLRQAQADLAAILHIATEAELRAVDDLQLPPAPERIDELYEAAIRCRPELQEWLHAIVRDQHIEELARLQYYPDVTLELGWQAINMNEAISPVANGNDNLAMGIGVNLPIWRGKLRAGVREAEHRIAVSSHRYDTTKDETFRHIRRLTVQAHSLEQQISLFQQSPDGIVPKAKQTLEASFVDYRVNKVDFQQLIDNWTDWLTYQIQVARLQATFGQTLASLERVVGCDPAELQGDEQPVNGEQQEIPQADGDTDSSRE